MNKHTQIVVIGAGIAGLSAARALQDRGQAVVILEGRDRIGGRIWTSRVWPNTPLDLGARWIHGIKKNPITALAKDANLPTVKTDYDNAWLYDTQGQLLDDDAWDYLEKLGKTIVRKGVRSQRKCDQGDCSLEEAIHRLDEFADLSATDRCCFNFYVNIYIEHELAADIAELSAIKKDDAEAFKGRDVTFPEGYDQVVHYLAEGLDIRLRHRVEKISYHDPVLIYTNQGQYQADKVIVTLPLGVLKQGQIEFSPALPDKKQAAIDTLGVGVLNGVYLRFPFPFWPKEAELLNYIPAEKGHWAEWFNIYHYTDQPILLGFNAGYYAWELEMLSDEDIVASAMQTLRTMYGSSIPYPDAWQIARWGADPFAHGSYSFNTVGASRKIRKRLAKPVHDRLFFAGEATSSDYPATVHGAYLSGKREAKRILKRL
ncbi:MAG: FAD-dependent oxidoreductase [Chloroflexota bacterium]